MYDEGDSSTTCDTKLSLFIEVFRCLPQLHLIALNSPQTGGMRGISGADFLCFSQAQKLGMKGTFRAFLSSKLEDLNSIVYNFNRENVNHLNGMKTTFRSTPSTAKMFSGTKHGEANKMMWHGSTSEGQRHVNNYCEAWRVGQRAVTGMASSLQSRSLLQQSASSCSSSFIVLCVENSYIHDSRRR
uniref:Collagenase NC10/endostatin domain-containing protein n=1 Tax=Cyprinodon variegatus TaxID=28743 RepID=A0A3Q2DII9_CYPVA